MVKNKLNIDRSEKKIDDVFDIILANTELSEVSKKILKNDAQNLSKKIGKNIREKWTIGRVALKLACDKNSCALKIHVPFKHLQTGRKICGIKSRVYPEQYLDAQISVLKNYFGCIKYDNRRIVLDNVRNWAIKQMKELEENPLSINYSPLSISLSFIYIGLIKYEFAEAQSSLGSIFNVQYQTIGRISRDLITRYGYDKTKWHKKYHRLDNLGTTDGGNCE